MFTHRQRGSHVIDAANKVPERQRTACPLGSQKSLCSRGSSISRGEPISLLLILGAYSFLKIDPNVTVEREPNHTSQAPTPVPASLAIDSLGSVPLSQLINKAPLGGALELKWVLFVLFLKYSSRRLKLNSLSRLEFSMCPSILGGVAGDAAFIRSVRSQWVGILHIFYVFFSVHAPASLRRDFERVSLDCSRQPS